MVRADDLAGFALVGGLTEGQLSDVAGCATEVTFPAGTHIFSEGHPADACWLVRSGRVALVVEDRTGSSVLQTLGDGDLLGWSWLVPPYRWRFGAIAAEPVAALRLDGEQLRWLIDRDATLGYALALQMLGVVAERLSSTRARLLDLFGNPRERREPHER